MAIIKSIRARGIPFSYHRIGAVHSDLRGHVVLHIASFVDREAAIEEGAEGHSLFDDVLIDPSFIEQHSEEGRETIEVPPMDKLYEYLLASSEDLQGGEIDE